MEGVNLGAAFLIFFALIVLGITSLVALGLLIAKMMRGALLTFAGGLLAACVITGLAALTFLQRGMGFHQEGEEPTLVLIATSLGLAGAGQFLAALRGGRVYVWAFAFTLGSLLFQCGLIVSADLFGMLYLGSIFGMRSLSVPWINLGLALSLLFASLSLLAGCLRTETRFRGTLMVALAGAGAIVGFIIGDVCVQTQATMIRGGGPGDLPGIIRVEVAFLGMSVSDETGPVRIPREGLELIRYVSAKQAMWVLGPLAVGALIGGLAGWLVAWGLTRSIWREPEVEPVQEPRGPPSEHIKPA